jgi:putative membrane protein
MQDVVLWLLIAAYLVDPVLMDAFPRQLSWSLTTPVAIMIPLLFALIHGSRRYGVGGIAMFLVLCLGISNVMENVGVATGFPFGHYHYTDVLGPKLFLVPLLIGPAYFGTGYLAWVLANLLLDTDRRREVMALVAAVILGTFIMVGWDVCLDPGSSTMAHIWIWEKGGGYFGVPLVNYLGWCLTVFLFLSAFAVWRMQRDGPSRELPKAHYYQAALFFLVLALDFPAGWLGGANRPIADATGKVWMTGDILETAAIVSLFTMVPFTVASLLVLRLRGTVSGKPR